MLVFAAAALAGCGVPKPGTFIEPDVAGVVVSTNGSTVNLPDRSVEIDTRSARALLAGSVIVPGQLLLSGEDFGQTWYIIGGLDSYEGPDCYSVMAATVYDESDGLVLVPHDWKQVGLRLPKRGDFSAKPTRLSAETGRYSSLIGENGGLRVCVDPDGFVFGIP